MFHPILKLKLLYDRLYRDPFTVLCVKSATQATIKSVAYHGVLWDPIKVHDQMFLAYGTIHAKRIEKLWRRDYPCGRTAILPGHLNK